MLDFLPQPKEVTQTGGFYAVPRKMTLEDGWFLLGRETRIVAQDHREAKRVARQIQGEIRERWAGTFRTRLRTSPLSSV